MKKVKKSGNLTVEKRWIPIGECTIKEIKEICDNRDHCEMCVFSFICGVNETFVSVRSDYLKQKLLLVRRTKINKKKNIIKDRLEAI